MPRIGAINRGTNLTSRNSENVTSAANMKGKMAVESRTRNGLKRHSDEQTNGIPESNTKTRRRAALEEITNAKSGNGEGGPGKETKTLKSQVKKGLSVIVNKTAAITNNTSTGKPSMPANIDSLKNRSLASNNQIKNIGNKIIAPLSDESSIEQKCNRKTRDAPSKKCKRQTLVAETSTSSIEEDIEMLSFDSRTESSSLPSSQETEDLAKELEVKANDLYKTVAEAKIELTTSQGELPPNRYEAPSRITPPDNIKDFDLENWSDPSQCSEYAQDIFQYYKNREEQFRCLDYLHSMPAGKRRGSIGRADITEGMRAILVDWLVEVQESFELNHETLYTAVKLMDLYLSKVFVTKEELQLVGATACLIACKIDERIPPSLDDFVYVCDDAYSRQEIMAKERDMIETVDYDVGYPLSYRFLRRYGRVCQVTMPVLTLARYILETSLMEYKFNVQLSESLLAAATLALAMKVQNIDESEWMAPLTFYSGYDVPNIRPVFRALHQMLFQDTKDATKTIRQKYSHRVFHEVALIKIPEVLDL